MKWKKRGLVFDCSDMPKWAKNSALTPTPFLITDDIIRVYCSFVNKDGVGQIGFVDVDSMNPNKILNISNDICLDHGKPGRFDDNGLILGDVIRDAERNIRMYYVGFQKPEKVKFLAFSGVAFSNNGNIFKRFSEAPILDRCNNGHSIRAIHTVIYEDEIYKIWYAVGDDWQEINGTLYPKYNIWYTESSDGLNFHKKGILCVDNEGSEYRIGRPSVIKVNDRYVMFYTKGSTSGKDYFPGVAFSDDGIVWERNDKCLGLSLGDSNEFDSRHLSYPRLIEANGKWFAFYNGNDMGKNGFGVAELLSW